MNVVQVYLWSYGRRPINYGSVKSDELSNIGYYFALRYWDMTSSVDLRQRSGWLGKLNVNYAKRYHFNGRFDYHRKSTDWCQCSAKLASQFFT